MQKAEVTPLLLFLRAASPDQKERCAALAGTSVNYLYQLATCKRPNVSAAMAISVEDATRLMHNETGGELPVVTVRTLVTMCSVLGFDNKTETATA